jgi:hypothetical protein
MNSFGAGPDSFFYKQKQAICFEKRNSRENPVLEFLDIIRIKEIGSLDGVFEDLHIKVN